MLVPGAGQLYVGARRLGLLLVSAFAAIVLTLGALAATHPFALVTGLAERRLVAGFVLANVALLVLRLAAVVDAWRRADAVPSSAAAVALVAIAALTAAPHVAAGYVAVRTSSVIDSVFAEEEPHDVLPARGIFLAPEAAVPEPEQLARPRPLPRVPAGRLQGSAQVLVGRAETGGRPWVTLLLLGSDGGPNYVGERTDTMIVAALQRGTGRAAAFGVPRNFVEVPLTGKAGRALHRFHQPLNALYSWARTRPELFPGGGDPGATVLKQTISRLLGIRVDYYALVDLAGFVDMVDALGGVDVHVKERLVDEVTKPKSGESKPRIDVYPGETVHLSGRLALAYVRSRKASNDYRRMARQRCFLSAMAQQLDVLGVLRHFESLAGTVQASVRTDVPRSRLPDLLRLVAAADPEQTVTETFGLDYLLRRRASDRYPIPNLRKVRAGVRKLILLPSPALAERQETIDRAC
jgi:LCP family protein required for cell wall assembly